VSKFDRSIAIRSTAALLVVLAALAGLSLAIFSHSDFKHWGFLIGPFAWLFGCIAAARLCRLDWKAGALGAVVAGIPSGLATAVGLHWLGIPLGAVCFALWCGWVGARMRSTA
jgi:hypothetical protein